MKLDYLEREAEYYKLDGIREKLNKSSILSADQMEDLMELCGFKRNQQFSLMSVQKILTTKNSKISTTSTKTIQRSTDKMKRNQKLKNSEDRS